jgi:hypothetical protein
MNGCCPQLPGFKPLEGGPAGLGRLHSVTKGRFRETKHQRQLYGDELGEG